MILFISLLIGVVLAQLLRPRRPYTVLARYEDSGHEVRATKDRVWVHVYDRDLYNIYLLTQMRQVQKDLK